MCDFVIGLRHLTRPVDTNGKHRSKADAAAGLFNLGLLHGSTSE